MLIETNCTLVEADYYGSRTYNDSMYVSIDNLPNSRPISANVGIDGVLSGQITRTSQPLEGIMNGGASDWIFVQARKTAALIAYIAGNPSVPRYLFDKRIHVEYDNYESA